MVCGIDIGGTKLHLAVYDDAMNQGHSWRVATPVHDYRAFLNALKRLVQSADEAVGERQAVGIAFPGIIRRDGMAISTNIPCVHGKGVMADIAETLSRGVVHLNDARAFTLSESHGGALDGAAIGMGIVLGTGVAGALCIGGRLYRGFQGAAGEYGHMPLPRNLLEKYGLPARPCPCGTDGCAEAFLSGPGLVRIGTRFGAGCCTAESLLQAANHRVAAARRSLEVYVDCLGYFVSRLTLLLDPKVIALGGGLSNVERLYGDLPAAVEGHLFDGVTAPVIAAPRFGAYSGVRGAAILAARLHESRRSVQGHGTGKHASRGHDL